MKYETYWLYTDIQIIADTYYQSTILEILQAKGLYLHLTGPAAWPWLCEWTSSWGSWWSCQRGSRTVPLGWSTPPTKPADSSASGRRQEGLGRDECTITQQQWWWAFHQHVRITGMTGENAFFNTTTQTYGEIADRWDKKEAEACQYF